MPEEQLKKVIDSWEYIAGHGKLGKDANKLIVQTLILLYDLKLMREEKYGKG